MSKPTFFEPEPDYSKVKRTREGYAKDGFVVSDSEEIAVRSKKREKPNPEVLVMEDEEPDVGICTECGDVFSHEAELAIGNNWGCNDCFKSAFKPKERAQKKKRAEQEAADLLECAEASVAVRRDCEVCESNDEVHYSGCPRSERDSLACYCGRIFCRDVDCYDRAIARFRLAMNLEVTVAV